MEDLWTGFWFVELLQTSLIRHSQLIVAQRLNRVLCRPFVVRYPIRRCRFDVELIRKHLSLLFSILEGILRRWIGTDKTVNGKKMT